MVGRIFKQVIMLQPPLGDTRKKKIMIIPNKGTLIVMPFLVTYASVPVIISSVVFE